MVCLLVSQLLLLLLLLLAVHGVDHGCVDNGFSGRRRQLTWIIHYALDQRLITPQSHPSVHRLGN